MTIDSQRLRKVMASFISTFNKLTLFSNYELILEFRFFHLVGMINVCFLFFYFCFLYKWIYFTKNTH